MNENRHPKLGRRQFLQGAAVAASGAVAPSALASIAQSGSTAATRHIALLLPESRSYPQLGSELAAGVQLALAGEAGSDAGWSVDVLQSGNSPAQAVRMLHGLVESGRYDAILGYQCRTQMEQVAARLQASNTLFVATELGANAVRSGTPIPQLRRSGLGYWQGHYALGAWAAEHVGRRLLSITSLYEAGYDLPFAFAQGAQAAGGQVVATEVCRGDGFGANFDPLRQWVDTYRPDGVMAHFSGAQAAAFLRAWHAQGLAGRVPLLGGQFLVEAAPTLAAGSIRLAAWDATMDTPANRHFVGAWQQRHGNTPSVFAALGYDAGQALLAASERATPLAAGYGDLRYQGLRGDVHYHAHADETLAMAVVQRIDQAGIPRMLTSLPVREPAATFWSALREQPHTGWMQPYLAI